MTPTFRTLSAIFTCAVAATATAQGKIEWTEDFAKACERAKAENKPIMACFSMKGERVCDVIIEEHYNDPKLLELSKHTINLFCTPHGTEAQRELEKRVRIDLLHGNASTSMIAPQHCVFMPDGTLIWAVPYYITAGELEWMWVHTIRKVQPDFPWEASDRYRAPRLLAAEQAVAEREQKPPPTQQEIKDILKEIKRGFGGYYGAAEKLPIIVRNEGQKAKEFVERLLDAHDTGPSERVAILRIIAANAPRSWWTVVKSSLDNEKQDVRLAAVNTLGQLGEKRSVATLVGRWRKEDVDEVRVAILHAAVACGPTNSQVIKLLPFVIADHEEETLRAQATIAIASLEDKKAVHEGLTAAFDDDSPRVRSAAAWAVASRRDEDLCPALEAALEAEQDAEAKKWLGAAREVIAGGTMKAFDKFPELAGR